MGKIGVDGHSFHVKVMYIQLNFLSDFYADPGYARQEVVNISGHMELQHLEVLQYDMRGSTILLVPSKLLAGLDDVTQFARQIILLTQ